MNLPSCHDGAARALPAAGSARPSARPSNCSADIGARGRPRAAALLALLAALAAAPAAAQGPGLPSPEELLRRVDANQAFDSIEYSGRMEILSGGKTRVKTMRASALGDSKALVEFTNPEDRGVRMLKVGKELWMYFPKEGDTVKISGHLLKEGMMGSDLSYEDALESDSLLEKYSASVLREEEAEGRPAWVLELKAKAPTANYDRRLLWIDKERYVALKGEMYARSGKLLKTSRVLEVARVAGRWFPVRSEISSAIKKGSTTTIAMGDLKLDAPIPESRFSLAELTK
ncbi:MAG TPA: outer membrane lipoprotein-sorting protein [Spirochaetia bacterium]|nr:outer membrane lipoprotein-sorting protein [Spirochaetales bacterium]HRY71770.1 outer membrane lipoprotein-sorting protein [Spirochaetia bacterium]